MRFAGILDGIARLSELRGAIERGMADAKAGVEDAVRKLVALLIAALIGVVGIGFVIAAVQIELAERIGPGLAALAIGAGLLLLALLMLLAGTRRRGAAKRRPRPAPASKPRVDAEQLMADAALDLADEIGRETRRNPGMVMLAALVMGVALGLERGGRRGGR